MKNKERKGNRDRGVILLKDLIPSKDPKAGKGRGEPAVFGAVPTAPEGSATTTEEEKRRKKDQG